MTDPKPIKLSFFAKRHRVSRKYARKPKAVYEDPVFRKGEVAFYPPDGYNDGKTAVVLRNVRGGISRQGFLEGVYPGENGLLTFICSDRDRCALFRFSMPLEDVEAVCQKRAAGENAV